MHASQLQQCTQSCMFVSQLHWQQSLICPRPAAEPMHAPSQLQQTDTAPPPPPTSASTALSALSASMRSTRPSCEPPVIAPRLLTCAAQAAQAPHVEKGGRGGGGGIAARHESKGGRCGWAGGRRRPRSAQAECCVGWQVACCMWGVLPEREHTYLLSALCAHECVLVCVCVCVYR